MFNFSPTLILNGYKIPSYELDLFYHKTSLGLITYSFPYIMLQLNGWTSLLADIFLGRINISNQFQILVSLIILIQYKLSFSFTYNTTIFGNLRFWHMLTDKSAVVGHESNVYVQVWSKCMILIESRKAVLFSETDLIRQRDLHWLKLISSLCFDIEEQHEMYVCIFYL